MQGGCPFSSNCMLSATVHAAGLLICACIPLTFSSRYSPYESIFHIAHISTSKMFLNHLSVWGRPMAWSNCVLGGHETHHIDGVFSGQLFSTILLQDPKKAEGLGWGDTVKLVTADVTSDAT